MAAIKAIHPEDNGYVTCTAVSRVTQQQLLLQVQWETSSMGRGGRGKEVKEEKKMESREEKEGGLFTTIKTPSQSKQWSGGHQVHRTCSATLFLDMKVINLLM